VCSDPSMHEFHKLVLPSIQWTDLLDYGNDLQVHSHHGVMVWNTAINRSKDTNIGEFLKFAINSVIQLFTTLCR
jgi:hypothetical protein